MKPRLFAAIVAIAAVFGSAAAYVLSGELGLVVVVTVTYGLGLLALRLLVPTSTSTVGRRPRPSSVDNLEFPSYRRIDVALSWAATSPRDYDRTLRPVLQRLLGVVLAQRYAVDLSRDPQAARRLVGDDLWPLVDPARLPSDDTTRSGVPLETLARVTDRLETL